jgi:YfiH family protein
MKSEERFALSRKEEEAMKTMMPQLLKYDLGTGVMAFSTTRHGGTSIGNYADFNINHYCGDDEEAIARNKRQLCQLLQIDERRLVYPHQTHDTMMVCVDEEFLALNDTERQQKLEGVDAIATNLPGVCIGVSTADCIPVLLYDRKHHVGAAIHAGWRGTVARIVSKTVRRLTDVYDCEPSDLRAVIGPGISLQSFEVGDEVWQAFREAGFDMSTISRRYPVVPALSSSDGNGPTEKWHIDLPGCNRGQLLKAGLLAEHIADSAICTFKSCDDFFSARRLGIRSGRVFTAIMLS